MSAAAAKPRTWAAVVRDASVGFTGLAEVVEDSGAGQVSSPNPAAFTVVAQVHPGDVIFGEVSEESVTAHGTTSRPTNLRLQPDGSLFPPDTLRQVPYWDYARTGPQQTVMVLLGEPACVRMLLGPHDDLPAAISQVREWTRLPGSDQLRVVPSDLNDRPASAVAYLAGFQLLSATERELVETVRVFLAIENRPPAGTAGMVNELQLMAANLPTGEVTEIAALLLED